MKNSKKIALCGMVGALSVTILLMGFMIPLATYACPAVSALSLILIPEKEFVLMYVLVFGLYTSFKLKADKIKPKFLQIAVKSLFAMLSTLLCYTILLVIFPNPLLQGEIGDAGIGLIIAFFIIFIITFLMYDFAAGKMLLVYRYRFRKKFFKG